MTAAGEFVAQPVWLPRYDQLKDQARKWFDDGQYTVSLILMQTAIELLTERYLSLLITKGGVPDTVKSWALEVVEPPSLHHRAQKLHKVLNPILFEKIDIKHKLYDPKIKKQYDPLMGNLKRVAQARDRIIHDGEEATPADAKNALETFLELQNFISGQLP